MPWQAAYTFDAGPNAVLFSLKEDVEELLSLINHSFPQDGTNGSPFIRGMSAEVKTPSRVRKDGWQSSSVSESEILYIMRFAVTPCEGFFESKIGFQKNCGLILKSVLVVSQR